MPRNIVNTISYVIRGENQISQATQSATSELRAVGGQARKTAGDFKQLAGAYNALIVSRRAAGFLAEMIAPAIEVEHAITKMAVATGMNATQTKEMTRAAIAAAGVTPFSPTEAIKGAQDLFMSIGNVNDTTKALIPTMELASTFFDKDMGRTTKAVSQILRGFNVESQQLPLALGQWVVAGRMAGVQLEEMDKGLTNLSGAAQLSGENWQQLVPLYALATSRFRNAARVGTGLTSMLQNILNPTKKSASAFGELGISLDSIRSASGGVDMQSLFVQLAESFKANRDNLQGFEAVLSRAFGQRAIRPVVALLSALTEGGKDAKTVLNDFNSATGKAGDVLTEMNQAALGPMGAQLQVLKTNLYAMAAAVLEKLIPVLTPIASFLASVADGVRYVFTELGPISWAFQHAFGAIAVGGILYVGVNAAVATIKAGLQLLGTAMDFVAGSTAKATMNLSGFTNAANGAAAAATSAAAAAPGAAAGGVAAEGAAAAGAGGGIGGKIKGFLGGATGGMWGKIGTTLWGASKRLLGGALKLGLAGAAIELGGWALQKVGGLLADAWRSIAETQKKIEQIHAEARKWELEHQKRMFEVQKQIADVEWRRAEEVYRDLHEGSAALKEYAFGVGKRKPAVTPKIAMGDIAGMEKTLVKISPELSGKGQAIAGKAITGIQEMLANAEDVDPKKIYELAQNLHLLAGTIGASEGGVLKKQQKAALENIERLRAGLHGFAFESNESAVLISGMTKEGDRHRSALEAQVAAQAKVVEATQAATAATEKETGYATPAPPLIRAAQAGAKLTQLESVPKYGGEMTTKEYDPDKMQKLNMEVLKLIDLRRKLRAERETASPEEYVKRMGKGEWGALAGEPAAPLAKAPELKKADYSSITGKGGSTLDGVVGAVNGVKQAIERQKQAPPPPAGEHVKGQDEPVK